MKPVLKISQRPDNSVYVLRYDHTSIMGFSAHKCSIMIHSLKIKNDHDKPLSIEKMDFIYKANGEEIQRNSFSPKQLNELFTWGKNIISLPPMLSVTKIDSFYDEVFCPSSELAEKTCGFIPKIYLECNHNLRVDELEISIKTSKSKECFNQRIVLKDYVQKNKFYLPMKGPLAILGNG